MKNQKMSTTLTIVITTVVTVCIFILYTFAGRSTLSMLKDSALEGMHGTLTAQNNIIDEYLRHQEDLMTAFSKSPEVAALLKDPENVEKQAAAQAYTEEYYTGLDDWEGLYVGEWNTHVITHSNPEVVGMTTRSDPDSLKQLQDAITKENGLYNTGIIVSPASGKLVLSMYCPVFDNDGKTILGYVGGGPFAQGLRDLLDTMDDQAMKYSLVNVESGIYIFDDDESKVASEIDDEVILSIIDELKSNGKDATGEKEYKDSDGNAAVAAYQYIPKHGWAVISRNLESNIYADAYKSLSVLGIMCIVCDIMIAILSFFFIRLSTRPLKYVERSILKLKQLKLEKQHNLDSYLNRRSKVGQIATAIDSLYDSFNDIVAKLNEYSDSLNDSAEKMISSSKGLVQCVEDNSNTTEQFAMRTENITDTVSKVDGTISSVADVVQQVKTKIQDGTLRSSELSGKVSQMSQTVESSLKVTNKRIEQNKAEIVEVMEGLQTLTRIDEMANQILEITEQTNLLSLNASIEAARAGEAGKGFAVVAGEIGSLANSSSETATEIQQICKETRENIGKIQKCFDNIVLFLQEDVQKQLQGFVVSSEEYQKSIQEIEHIILDIQQSANVFVEAVFNIKDEINSVQSIPGDTFISTDQMIAKGEEIERLTSDLSELVNRNRRNADSIQEVVARFT